MRMNEPRKVCRRCRLKVLRRQHGRQVCPVCGDTGLLLPARRITKMSAEEAVECARLFGE